MNDWETNQRADAYLLTGGRLAQHQAWTQSASLTLTPTGREYLERSTAHDVTLQRRRRRRRNIITAAFATAAVIASAFALVALRNARTADQRSELARAEALAASALAVIDSDPELAVLLGIQAIETAPESTQAGIALNTAVQNHRTIFRLEAAFEVPFPGAAVGSISPDGELIAVSFIREIQVWEVGSTDGPLWVSQPGDGTRYSGAFFSTDGNYVIAEQSVLPEDDRQWCEFERFRILDATTGEIVREIAAPRATGFLAGPAQTGPRVDLTRPLIRGEIGEGCDDSGGVGDLVGLDLLSGERTILGTGATFWNRLTGVPTVSEDGSRLATTGDSTLGAVTDLRTGEELLDLPFGMSTLSSDGSMILAGNNPLELWHVDDQERLRDFQGDFSIAWFSPSERLVYGATVDGRVVVFDLESGALLFELRGHSNRVVELQMTQDESKIATFAFDGTARVWDIGSAWTSTTGPESFDAYLGDLYATFGVSNTYVTSDALLAERIIWDRGSLLFETTSYDPETGQDRTTYPGLLLAVSHDEEHVALQETGSLRELSDEEASGPGTGGFYTRIGGFRIADLTTGATVVDLEGLCDWYFNLSGGGIVPTEDCEVDGIPWREFSTVGTFSPDDSMFAMAGQSGRFAVWDTSSGAILWRLGDGDEELPPGGEGEVEFSPDGNHLLLSQGPNMEVWDTSSWTKVAEFSITREPDELEFTPDGSQLVLTDGEVVIFDTQDWQEIARLSGQQGGQIRDMALDPTGRFAATAGWDSESWVWDLERREVVHRFSFPALDGGMRNVQWFDEETLVLGSEDWAVMMSLNPEVLAQNARDRLTRSFTAEECNTYDIDPCPTLEELKLGS